MNAEKKINELLLHLNINAKVLSEELGYTRPQIIYDILKGKTKSISEELAVKITSVYPEISRAWLLADEGEMLKPHITQEIKGDNNTAIAGNSTQVNNSKAIEKALDEISEIRKLLADTIRNNKEQSDRFLNILEKMQIK